MLRIPSGAPRAITKALTGGPLGLASSLLGLGGRLRPPSEVRAAAALAKILPRAMEGNLQAVRAIIYRATSPTIGVFKERMVWQTAAAGLPAALVRQANARAAELDAITDHSNPETVARSITGGGTAVSKFVLPPVTGFAPEPLIVGRRASDTGLVAGTRSKRKRKAKARLVSRYNPSTGRKVKVRADSAEAAEWSSTKPRRMTKAQRRLETQATRAVERTIGTGLRKGGAALGAAGARVGLSAGASAAYLAAAGLIAYAVTRQIIKDKQEGNTLQNAFSVAVARAHRLAAQRLGRQVTRAELIDLRQRIAAQLQKAITAGTLPPPLGAVYSLINKLIGR